MSTTAFALNNAGIYSNPQGAGTSFTFYNAGAVIETYFTGTSAVLKIYHNASPTQTIDIEVDGVSTTPDLGGQGTFNNITIASGLTEGVHHLKITANSTVAVDGPAALTVTGASPAVVSPYLAVAGNNAAVKYFGYKDTPGNYAWVNGELTFSVTGTEFVLTAYHAAGTGPNCYVTVDGVTTQLDAAGAHDSSYYSYTLFTGAAEGSTHQISILNTSTTQSWAFYQDTGFGRIKGYSKSIQAATLPRTGPRSTYCDGPMKDAARDTSVRVAFTGTSLEILTDGPATGKYVSVVDGTVGSVTSLTAGSNWTTVATGLTNGPHVVEVYNVHGGWTFYAARPNSTGTLTAPVARVKTIFIGDSVTATPDTPDTTVGFAHKISKRLHLNSVNIGVGGDTVTLCRTRLASYVSAVTGGTAVAPDLANIEIGVNDKTTGVSSGTFTTQYTGLLSDLVTAFPSIKGLCQNIWDTAASVYNGIIASSVTSAGSNFALSDNVPPIVNPATETSDGIHMTSYGYDQADTRWSAAMVTLMPSLDPTPPTFTARTVPAAGTTLVFTLSEAVTESSGSTGFSITGSTSISVGAWTVSGTTLTLTPSATLCTGDTLTVSGTAGTLHDLAGNALVTITADTVTNNSTVAGLVSGTLTAGSTTGTTGSLSWGVSTGGATKSYSVEQDNGSGVYTTVASVGTTTTYTYNFSSNPTVLTQGQTTTPIRIKTTDSVGRTSTSNTVTFTVPDVTAPTISTKIIPSGGTTLVATLSEAVSETSGTTGFTVNVAGTTIHVNSWAVSSTTLTLNLSAKVCIGETVTFSATTGTLHDLVGNALVAFSGISVTNNSTQAVLGRAGTPTATIGATDFTVSFTAASGGSTKTYEVFKIYSDDGNANSLGLAPGLSVSSPYGASVGGTIALFYVVTYDDAGRTTTSFTSSEYTIPDDLVAPVFACDGGFPFAIFSWVPPTGSGLTFQLVEDGEVITDSVTSPVTQDFTGADPGFSEPWQLKVTDSLGRAALSNLVTYTVPTLTSSISLLQKSIILLMDKIAMKNSVTVNKVYTLGNTGSYTVVEKIKVEGARVLILEGIPSVTLANLKLSEALFAGGTRRKLAEGTDFQTSTVKIPDVLPRGADISVTPATTFFRITILVLGVEEITLEVQPAANGGQLELSSVISY